jgi:hypothetical protein
MIDSIAEEARRKKLDWQASSTAQGMPRGGTGSKRVERPKQIARIGHMKPECLYPPSLEIEDLGLWTLGILGTLETATREAPFMKIGTGSLRRPEVLVMMGTREIIKHAVF